MAAKNQDAPDGPRAAPRARRRSAAAPADAPAQAPQPAKRGKGKAPVDLGAALLHAFATSERINQYLLEHLDPQAWDAPAPIGKGRTIRALVAHLHNVRHMWLTMSAPDAPAPAKVERTTLTLADAKLALAASGTALGALLGRALADGGRVKNFKPDVVGFVAYLVAHEAHHRGQICLLARMLGKPLPQAANYGMWEWRKRGDELA